VKIGYRFHLRLTPAFKVQTHKGEPSSVVISAFTVTVIAAAGGHICVLYLSEYIEGWGWGGGRGMVFKPKYRPLSPKSWDDFKN
jgi:hypothetical protein